MSGNPVVLRWNQVIPSDTQVGWRIPVTDEPFYMDIFWGSTRDANSLKLLLEDVERQYGKKEVIDLRTKDEILNHVKQGKISLSRAAESLGISLEEIRKYSVENK